MEDLTIKCVQCNDEFVFTAGEQRYYEERNFSNPRRCPQCRKNKARLDGNPGRPPRLKREHSAKQPYEE